MYRVLNTSLLLMLFCIPATAGLTVSDQLSAVLGSNNITASVSAQVAGAANDDGTLANLVAVGDVVETVFAFSGTKGTDTDYAALLFRSTGTSETSHVIISSAGLGSQKTVFATQEGFDYSPNTFNFTDAESLIGTGSNNVAYLVTSDTYDFSGKTFSEIETNSSAVNLVATYSLDTGSTLEMESILTGGTGSDDNVVGSVEIRYELKLTQTGILSAEASNFDTVDGTNSAIAVSSLAAGQLFDTTFDSTDPVHSFSGSNSLEFNTLYAVPEPSSLAVLGLVGLAVGLRTRRRR